MAKSALRSARRALRPAAGAESAAEIAAALGQQGWPGTVVPGGGQARPERWFVTLVPGRDDGGRALVPGRRARPIRKVLLDTSCFATFRRSIQGLSADEIDQVITILARETEHQIEPDLLGRRALLLHIFLLWRRTRARPPRQPVWDCLLGSLSVVLAKIPPTAPPLTLWLFAYHRQAHPDRRWALLEKRLATFDMQPPGDETGLLACWLAARELLCMAVEERSSSRVTRALRHYKLYISGRYAHAVGKGDLSSIVEADIVELSVRFPAFLDLERQERGFFENWLLARFAILRAPKVALAYRGRKSQAGLALGAVALIVGLFFSGLANCPASSWLPRLGWTATAFFLLLVLCLASTGIFRVFYPRLFAGAVLGWSTLLGELGAHRLFAEGHGMPWVRHQLCQGEVETLVLLPLIALPFFFLTHEVLATLASWPKALFRATLMMVWAILLVGAVGAPASLLLEKIVCQNVAGECHRALFVAGCIVSLYFTIVIHLVWGDEAMSATLAHERRG